MTSGVYALVRDGRCIYVGASFDTERRIRMHRRSGRQFNSAVVAPCAKDVLALSEACAIEWLAPEENTYRPMVTWDAGGPSVEGRGVFSVAVGSGWKNRHPKWVIQGRTITPQLIASVQRAADARGVSVSQFVAVACADALGTGMSAAAKLARAQGRA